MRRGAGAGCWCSASRAWDAACRLSRCCWPGIAINSMCMALILFVHSIAGLTQSFSITRWMMGGIDAVEYCTLAWLALLVSRRSQWCLARAVRGT